MRAILNLLTAVAVLVLAQGFWHWTIDPVFPDPRLPVQTLPWQFLGEVPATIFFAFLASGLWTWGPPLLLLAALLILAGAATRRFLAPAVLAALLILQAAGFQAAMISAGV